MSRSMWVWEADEPTPTPDPPRGAGQRVQWVLLCCAVVAGIVGAAWLGGGR